MILLGAAEETVAIRVRLSGPSADSELSSLYAWLRDEPDIRRHADMKLLAAEPGPADMGAAFDVLQLVVDGGFQALNFALAYATWRATRPSRSQITIEREGVKVTLDGAEPDAVEMIVRALKQEA